MKTDWVAIHMRFKPEEFQKLQEFTENAYGEKITDKTRVIKKALMLLDADNFGLNTDLS